jgi:hypothetical protein
VQRTFVVCRNRLALHDWIALFELGRSPIIHIILHLTKCANARNYAVSRRFFVRPCLP